MKWYYYVALIVMALICYFVVVGARTRKAFESKKAAERKAAKEYRAVKKKRKK